MPTPHRPHPATRRALHKLGGDIREARLRRKLPMEIVAQRAATSRPTVARIEKGDPSVGVGIVAAGSAGPESAGTVGGCRRSGPGWDRARHRPGRTAETGQSRPDPQGEERWLKKCKGLVDKSILSALIRDSNKDFRPLSGAFLTPLSRLCGWSVIVDSIPSNGLLSSRCRNPFFSPCFLINPNGPFKSD